MLTSFFLLSVIFRYWIRSIDNRNSMLDVWWLAELATACKAMARAGALAGGRTEATQAAYLLMQMSLTPQHLMHLPPERELFWNIRETDEWLPFGKQKMILLDNKSFRQKLFHLSSSRSSIASRMHCGNQETFQWPGCDHCPSRKVLAICWANHLQRLRDNITIGKGIFVGEPS